MAIIGVIGGSGLYHIEGMEILEERSMFTPLGQPSCNFVLARFKGVDVVFLPRHGRGHRISPSDINYRANIWGMKKLGVAAIIAVSAVGSLKEEYQPQHFVVPDQLFDRTKGKRADTFFEEGLVGHIPFADPFSPEIREIILKACRESGVTVHDGGAYVNIEGPQFSTKAESRVYRGWGMDIIGMTNLTEAKLAREAEISYATLAAVTDYDCWHPSHESVTVEMIMENLNNNVANARKILEKAIVMAGALKEFSAEGTLQYSIVTDRGLIPEDMKKKLELLIGKYIR
jgi:5'-methylthioadenosine phosphorylase